MTDEEIQEIEQEQRKQRFPAVLFSMWEEDGLHDKSYLRFSFDNDDKSNPKISRLCQKYCTRIDDVKKNNIGILFFGDIGGGKSFFASCTCNEILNLKNTTICATSISRILNTAQSARDRQRLIDRLSSYQMLMLDDFGSERGTEFAMEQVFSIIDARYRAQLPVIITTNLTLNEMENPTNISDSRLFDRVLEMCPIRVHVPGSSKRKAEAERRTQLARELLK